MTKTYFSIISSISEEHADGYVEYTEDGQKSIVYKDPLFEVYWANEFPFTKGELHDTLKAHDFDPSFWTDGFETNEFGIYRFRDFDFLINGSISESFMNTLIRMKKGTDDSSWEGGLPRASVGDVLAELSAFSWNHYVKVSPCMAYVRYIEAGSVNHKLLKIHYGDSEIADAVEHYIHKMDMTFVDKTGDE